MKLNNKYVIGTNVMWFEIEMYRDFIDGLVNLLDANIENKENITIDLCLNLSQHLEKLDTDKITEDRIITMFQAGVSRIEDLGYEVKTFQVEKDEFYFHTDYRRDLNYNYCKKVDYVMWGETLYLNTQLKTEYINILLVSGIEKCGIVVGTLPFIMIM